MTEKTFEENIKRLEEIVRILEEGKCSLDESLKLFEEGIELSKKCNITLDDAKQKITLLSELESGE
ncbi:MAG: exodeoxyribonuclease VII small subunit [Ruminococcaceae bacterium]|nr:exodeoxyribonuclease VII small subunit [Oscillospiraceae bacterium]